VTAVGVIVLAVGVLFILAAVRGVKIQDLLTSVLTTGRTK